MYRLRGSDAQFIYNESPTSPFATLKVMIYEPVDPADRPTFAELAGFIQRGLSSLGRRGLPFRVLRVPFDLHHPLWVMDPHFSIEDHFHHVVLPPPGDKAALCTFISHVLGMPLDPNRPLWHAWIVEGLDNGRIAIVAKLHHVLADGQLSAQAIAQIHRQGDEPEQPVPTAGRQKLPGNLHLTGQALVDLMKSYTVEFPSHYRQMRARHKASRTMRQAEKKPSCGPFSAPYTFLNGPGGQYRLYRYEMLPLGEAKRLAKALGCTLNTLVMGLCSEALRRYFLAVADLPREPLVTVMPVAVTRAEDGEHFLTTDRMNNSVAVTFVPLDLSIRDFRERLSAINAGTTEALYHVRATDGARIDNLADYLPGSFFRLLNAWQSWRQKRQKSPLANLSISNVPGPREPIYACNGRLKMVELLSAGNLADAVNLTVTVWSYLDNLCFSCLYRKGAIPEPERFNRYLAEIYQEQVQVHLTDAKSPVKAQPAPSTSEAIGAMQ